MLSDKWRQSQLEAMGVPLHLSGKFVELEITDSDLERLGFAPSVGDREFARRQARTSSSNVSLSTKTVDKQRQGRADPKERG